MIAVIADDFTGAAEIGGIGVRHGFHVTILNNMVEKIDTDILIVATDTRSQVCEQSGVFLNKITKALLELKPDFIYKKIDSLLRGNVGEELMVQLEASQKKRALIIPANPALRRTIENGIYLFQGRPLQEYPFSESSVATRRSSKVLDLIGEGVRPFTTIISTDGALPEEGLIIGNTSNNDDLKKWAQKMDSGTIPSGGSGFFDALLHTPSGSGEQIKPPIRLGEKALYVCGSAFILSRKLVKKAKESGQTVIYMPENLICDCENDAIPVVKWAAEIVKEFNNKNKVILAVDKIDCPQILDLSLKIRQAFAEVILQVMKEIKIDELIIEGGATAYSIIEKLEYKKLYPVQELGPGVIRMKVEENKNIYLTLKPGSYQWPETLWED